MKKRLWISIVLTAIIFSVSGCIGDAIKPPVTIVIPDPMKTSAECNAKLDAITSGKEGPSLIRQRIPNPCDALTYAVTLAKAGVIWDLYKAGALAQWGVQLKEQARVANMTYADLNLLLSKQIVKFNGQLGGTYLLLSSLLVQFNDKTVISPADMALFDAGVDVIVAEARRLAMITGSMVEVRHDA
jgi:hypothetical protein